MSPSLRHSLAPHKPRSLRRKRNRYKPFVHHTLKRLPFTTNAKSIMCDALPLDPATSPYANHSREGVEELLMTSGSRIYVAAASIAHVSRGSPFRIESSRTRSGPDPHLNQ